NKYVHTPRGLFELKYFFNSGLGSSINSDGVAPEVVKEYLQKMVSGESPENPLSDQEITAALKNQYNIDIARRTVAKYREVLGISPSSRRKRHL
ncbi:MAG: RNA polymerase sigma-54 factor, partial [bacterium]|nr:RNA polymerase sigma-54 factor [bacterium]